MPDKFIELHKCTSNRNLWKTVDFEETTGHSDSNLSGNFCRTVLVKKLTKSGKSEKIEKWGLFSRKTHFRKQRIGIFAQNLVFDLLDGIPIIK